MKRINENTYSISGNLYTDMYMDPRLLEDSGITIHVKGDVFFGVLRPPNRLKSGDAYLLYEDIIHNYGSIYDIIAFSNAFK